MSVKPDILVIGSGISGLSFALQAVQWANVTVVAKDSLGNTATSRAQGGIAAALGAEDTVEQHVADTLEAGAGLCDEDIVRIVIEEGQQRVEEWLEKGITFVREGNGELELAREGGHSQARVLHGKDQTGKMIQDFLLEQVRQNSEIRLLENTAIVDLITEHHTEEIFFGSHCYGAYILDESSGEITRFLADYTYLATGGAGHIYAASTNPDISTGDGVALALRAGARVRNMEFYQFHPTAHVAADGRTFLISEAVRGEGAKLYDASGKRFMEGVHELAELAPRDIVSLEIDKVLKQSGTEYVYLDITHFGEKEIKERFPHIYQTMKDSFGIDITKERIPVVPAAHYMCGGVLVDEWGQTDLNGLFAGGEVASTGLHGANRLASNSLLEGLVFGDRSARKVQELAEREEHMPYRKFRDKVPEWMKGGAVNTHEWILVRHDIREIQQVMWDYIGIVRTHYRLERARRRIELLYREIMDFYQRTVITREVIELRNLVIVAKAVILSAMSRRESRGLHQMSEYPENRNPSRKDTIIDPSIF